MAAHFENTDHLPHVTSDVEHFLVNRRGDAEGLMLANGLEVHFPADFSAEVMAVVRAGDRVKIYGTLPRTEVPILAAVAIETAHTQVALYPLVVAG